MPQHTPDWLLSHIHEVYAPEVKRNIHYIIANHRDVLLFLAETKGMDRRTASAAARVRRRARATGIAHAATASTGANTGNTT